MTLRVGNRGVDLVIGMINDDLLIVAAGIGDRLLVICGHSVSNFGLILIKKFLYIVLEFD